MLHAATSRPAALRSWPAKRACQDALVQDSRSSTQTRCFGGMRCVFTPRVGPLHDLHGRRKRFVTASNSERHAMKSLPQR